MPNSSNTATSTPPVTACLIGACDIELWGMTGSERAERMVTRAGIDEILIAGFEIDEDRTALFIRTDTIIDEAFCRSLLKQPGTLVAIDGPDGKRAIAAHVTADKTDIANQILSTVDFDPEVAEKAGLTVRSPGDVAGGYDAALRKTAAPLVRELTPETVREIEHLTFDASYKGVTDFVTKWVWPKIAFRITRVLSRSNVTPNTVTTASFICVIATLICFITGAYLTGIAFAWLMALLDTVDGKLARVTLTSSKWGNVFDHGIDLVSPPFWWLAWWWGLENRTDDLLTTAMWIVVGGYVAGKLLEQAFISSFRLKIHMWQSLDSLFRQITSRRNPNLAILTVFTLSGRPDIAFLAVAAWTIICFVFHSVRLVQAFMLQSKGTKISSWLDA